MKKRILHVLASNSFSGAENVACTIIENNPKFDMYYCCPNGPIVEELKKRKIKYIELKKISPKYLNKICNKYKIDVIHAHDLKASFISSFCSKNRKVISHLHCNYPFLKKWNIYSIAYYLRCKHFDKIVGVSGSIVHEAVFGKKIENKFVRLYNCVDKKRIIKLASEKYENKYDVYFVGRLIESKNPLKFIEIISKLKENNNNIKAVIIGDGEMRDVVYHKIYELGLENNIDMVGFQANPFKIMYNSKICLMPSIFEGFGLTAIEGMILGKPVLNSFVGGLNEIFINNKEFSLDIDIINKLLTDEKVYAEYSKNAIKITDKYTNILKYNNIIHSLYKEN